MHKSFSIIIIVCKIKSTKRNKIFFRILKTTIYFTKSFRFFHNKSVKCWPIFQFFWHEMHASVHNKENTFELSYILSQLHKGFSRFFRSVEIECDFVVGLTTCFSLYCALSLFQLCSTCKGQNQDNAWYCI